MKDVKIVIGANFGDEGKGLMTDYFADDARRRGESALVVCSNGGAQRGHTVKVKGNAGNSRIIRHVFHHFGSGTFAGAATYLPRFFIVNPMLFMKEYSLLLEMVGEMQVKATDADLKVYVHPDCPVSTPFDMILNQILEESRGNARHGSCGMGIWETLVRNGKTFSEMAEMTDFQMMEYLRHDCKMQLWNRLREKKVDIYRDEWNEIINDDGLIEHYVEDFRNTYELCKLADVDIFDRYDRIIFENGQGLLLDRCRKEYGNNTTPSNTGLRNPAVLLREYYQLRKGVLEDLVEPLIEDLAYIGVEVCYVTRTYLTRHGAGRFDEQCDKAVINPDMVDLTNVPNPHQGTMRYGMLDKGVVLRRIREDYDSERFPDVYNPRRTLAVTHCNEYLNDIMNKADYLSDGEIRESVVNNSESTSVYKAS